MTSRWLDCAYRSLCFAAAIILVLVIAYSHMTNTQMLTERASRLELSMDGTAEEPFAHRILIPVSIRTMVSITPEPLLRAMEHWGAPLGKKLLPPDMPATSRPVYYYYFALLSVCSLLIYGVLSRRLFRRLVWKEQIFWSADSLYRSGSSYTLSSTPHRSSVRFWCTSPYVRPTIRDGGRAPQTLFVAVRGLVFQQRNDGTNNDRVRPLLL
jgi:hypothetical protein